MADASSVDFRALQLFIAVYDNQSFSVVARREGVSPSLISRTIQQLEDALGQQLFYRNTRAVVPTEAGRLFAASCRSRSSPPAGCATPSGCAFTSRWISRWTNRCDRRSRHGAAVQ